VKDYPSTIKKIHDHGMIVHGNFIFRFDTDCRDIFDKTVEMIYDWEIDLCLFNVLTPFPGTPLFDRLEMEGRILTKDWAKYDLETAVFQPKHMSPQELEKGTLEVQNIFSSTFNIVKSLTKSMKIGLYPFLINGLRHWRVKFE
jgi:radical SAM superfamily enzyme YgiQ (UPF0313 family)